MTTQPASILIVEDDPEIGRLLADFLQREGFDVECAGSGKAMDAVLQRLRPDLLVLDLMLPGEDGLRSAAGCARRRHIPILMLTAKSDEIDRVVGLEMGADDYLAKPFAPRELLARVRAILRRVSAAPAKPPSGASRSTACRRSRFAQRQYGEAATTSCSSPAPSSTCSAASCCGRAGC